MCSCCRYEAWPARKSVDNNRTDCVTMPAHLPYIVDFPEITGKPFCLHSMLNLQGVWSQNI